MNVKYILIWGTANPEVKDFNNAMKEWEKTVKAKNCEMLYWE